MSPLRVKNLSKGFFREEGKKESHEFYGDGFSDEEKVVVCSVISSVREGDESLNNTQKYVPLRQKVPKVETYAPVSQLKCIVKNEQQKHFQLLREEQSLEES